MQFSTTIVLSMAIALGGSGLQAGQISPNDGVTKAGPATPIVEEVSLYAQTSPRTLTSTGDITFPGAAWTRRGPPAPPGRTPIHELPVWRSLCLSFP